jgi:hypothetical protein
MHQYIEHAKNIKTLTLTPRIYASRTISRRSSKAFKWAVSYVSALSVMFASAIGVNMPFYVLAIVVAAIVAVCMMASAPLYWFNRKSGLTYIQATTLYMLNACITYTIPILYWQIFGLQPESPEFPAPVGLLNLVVICYFGYYVVPAMLSELTGKSIWRSIGSLLLSGLLAVLGFIVIAFAIGSVALALQG